ncbi:MAG: right-handed parallel beta-helix repeat-containing protein [Amaricoccus sp.]
MANISVSTTSALKSALKSAANGDVITLNGGHYTLDVSGLSKAVTITSNGSAVIDEMNLSKVSNLTIDGVDFNGIDGAARALRIYGSNNVTIKNGDLEGVASGFGAGKGLAVQTSSNVTVENMTIHGFDTGIRVSRTDGVKLLNNTLTNMSHDGIDASEVHGAVISGNSISLDIPLNAEAKHTDGIQMWNLKGMAASTDVLIEDNFITTHNKQSHGIFMGNAAANQGGGAGTFFQNVVIQDNTIVSGDGLGLSWGQTNHLDINHNIILFDTALTFERSLPSIRVSVGATDVSVTGNITHKVPQAADSNWQTKPTPAEWNITGNTLVALGTTLTAAQALLAAANGGSSGGKSAGLVAFAADTDTLRQADTFSFDSHGKTDVVRGLDFDAGDRIVLHDFAAGTFGSGRHGTGAIIGSLDDLKALDQASSAVSVHAGRGDTLVIDIDQPGHDHAIRLVGMAHEYF